MNYIVYKTTNLVNGKIYIGVHGTVNPEKFDGYLGCGVYTTKPSTYNKKRTDNSIFPNAVKKYGVNNFKRETLFVFQGNNDGRIAAYKKEGEIVNEEFIKLESNYNVSIGGICPIHIQMGKIIQYDLDGNFIKIWNNRSEAESYYNCKNQISKNIRNVRNSAAGFQWTEYKENYPLTIQKYKPQNKTVYQFDLSGEFIKAWRSVGEAAKAYANSISAKSAIMQNCNGRKMSALGFYWSYQRKFCYKFNIKDSAVASYDDNGSIVKIYNNAYDAASDLKISNCSGIIDSVRGTHKRCKGLRWRLFFGDQKHKICKLQDDDMI